ncbi:ribokinase [Bacillus alkalicellulosilyticus]|uniref:ribokinase n=1 Tax=Alkalihalobacterium alkalicellulosilyticum TaxID=1912214 RepID=UPI0009965371|nr:ribokinase [Bacillus alkalicellulosilyticus]
MSSRIVVVGSINMDLVTVVDTFPIPGETRIGSDFKTVTGGKGANQAVAAARLGAEVTMIGCVGDDAFGIQSLQVLEREGIVTDHVKQIKGVETGIAAITVSGGENQIVVVPGANSYVTPEYIKEKEQVIKDSDIVLIQLEIPIATVEAVALIANRYQTKIIVNPAPIQALPAFLLETVDYITPNEHEVKQLDVPLCKGEMVITKGEEGVSIKAKEGNIAIPAHRVQVVDTTGAGDTFNGALAVALCEGKSIVEASQFAVAASALSVLKFGAQAGMPTLQEVEEFINDKAEKGKGRQ